ncbi:nucleolar protein 56-like [Prunus yedoensis var. nudiflora]|uniref:Nucleolar protein 56-like n=1 Tax=Prunus yedoensis var. nudiflora TaxID=2094558 RepID=A0A314UAQ5_PRUYE|nr:nucleolar protein 56-like [Prunus yedoensis var. nudiflora]
MFFGNTVLCVYRDNCTTAFGEKLREQVEERLEFYDKGVAPRKNIHVMKSAIFESSQSKDAEMDAEEVPTEPAEPAVIGLDKSEKRMKKGKRKGNEIMEDANNERVDEDGAAKQKKMKKSKHD